MQAHASLRLARCVLSRAWLTPQNNGRIAHQEVDHVHFHMIPKPEASDKSGLVVGWPGMSHAMTNANRQFKVLVQIIRMTLTTTAFQGRHRRCLRRGQEEALVL